MYNIYYIIIIYYIQSTLLVGLVARALVLCSRGSVFDPHGSLKKCWCLTVYPALWRKVGGGGTISSKFQLQKLELTTIGIADHISLDKELSSRPMSTLIIIDAKDNNIHRPAKDVEK